MAHKKAAGSTRNGRDSAGKRLGIKVFGGRPINAGSIIMRQRGTKYRPGEGVLIGRDHTISAKITGTVLFTEKRVRKYDGRVYRVTMINVSPSKN